MLTSRDTSLAIPQELPSLNTGQKKALQKKSGENLVFIFLNMLAHNLNKDGPQGPVHSLLLFFLHTKSKGSVMKLQVELMPLHYRPQRALHYTTFINSKLYTCFTVPDMIFAGFWEYVGKASQWWNERSVYHDQL